MRQVILFVNATQENMPMIRSSHKNGAGPHNQLAP